MNNIINQKKKDCVERIMEYLDVDSFNIEDPELVKIVAEELNLRTPEKCQRIEYCPSYSEERLEEVVSYSKDGMRTHPVCESIIDLALLHYCQLLPTRVYEIEKRASLNQELQSIENELGSIFNGEKYCRD